MGWRGGYPPELAWWSRALIPGEGVRKGWLGRADKLVCTGAGLRRGKGSGGGARGVGGGTHRSWPGGRGGRPRALVAGEGWGGRRGDGSFLKGGLVGCSKEEQVQGRGQGRVGLAVGGGARACGGGRW